METKKAFRAEWTTKEDSFGWVTHTRGNCQIQVSPSGERTMLFAPACTTEHKSLAAAKRAAGTRLDRGW